MAVIDLDLLDRDTLARVLFASHENMHQSTFTFAQLYPERQDVWRETGDRFRAMVEEAIRQQEEATNHATQ